MISGQSIGFSDLLSGLRAAGEETRLRILALLREGELNVSDLTEILGQSQPRISRHLKLLTDVGLIERNREGAWAFFRLAEASSGGAVAQLLASRLDADDPILAADRSRLAQVRQARSEAAQAYFARHASEWDRIRSLHAPEPVVEAAIVDAVGDAPVRAFLDLGTGTGRMLSLVGRKAQRLVGIDASPAMLTVARANLEADGLTRAELRQGDIYALRIERNSFDLVLLHQVLHFLDDPGRALREAALALSPGGRLLVVDFAPHDLEFLRDRHAHRRLGFSREQIAEWMNAAGLDLIEERRIAPPSESARQALTVSLWLGRDRRVVTDAPFNHHSVEAA